MKEQRSDTDFTKEQQEFKEDPKISYDIFYAAHGTSEDIKDLDKKIADADVFVPENLSYGPRFLKIYQEVSHGELTPDEALKDLQVYPGNFRYLFWLHQMEAIYNTNKQIVFVDTPRGYNFLNKEPRPLSLSSDFPKALTNMRTYIKKNADFQKEREDYMLSQLKPKLRALISDNPVLREKPVLKVLMLLGAFHTRLFHELKKVEDVKEGFSSQPFTYDFITEGVRRETFNKNISNELVAKMLLSAVFAILYLDLRKLTEDSAKILYFIRTVTSQFSFTEIEEMWKHFDFSSAKTAHGAGTLKSFLRGKLAEKGFKFPTTEKEIDELINQKYKKR